MIFSAQWNTSQGGGSALFLYFVRNLDSGAATATKLSAI